MSSLPAHPPPAVAAGSPGAPRKLLSVILPAYNEQDVLPLTVARFTAMQPRLAELGFELELLFVNDGSADNTPEMLNDFAGQHRCIRAIHLTRNFGHQAAVTAGLTLAAGDVVAIMDCDLQDPPEILPQFLDRWRQGYQVVYAVRTKRKENIFKRAAYFTFYRILRWISDIEIPLDSGDFCVMDRAAVDLLNSLPERQRFVRGLRTWIGLKQIGVAYEREARQAGVPQYTFRKLLKLALDGMVSFSNVPLKLVTRLGAVGVVMTFALTLWVVFDALFVGLAPRGWASLACLVLFLGSLNLLALGVIGEYLSRIFIEVKGRPTFLIASVVGSRSAATPAASQAQDAAR